MWAPGCRLLGALVVVVCRATQVSFPWTSTAQVPPGCSESYADDSGDATCGVTHVDVVLSATISGIDAVDQYIVSKLDMTLIWTDNRTVPWIPTLIFDSATSIKVVSESAPVPFNSRYFKNDAHDGTLRLFQKRVLLVTHRSANQYKTFPFDGFEYEFTIGMETDMNGNRKWVDLHFINDAKDDGASGRSVLTEYSPVLVTDGYYINDQSVDDTTFGVLEIRYTGERIWLPYVYKFWIPSLSFTIVSFITLWVPVRELMPRLGVSAVMLLTTANFLQQVMKELPILDEVTLMEMMIVVQIVLICAIAIFHVIVHRVDHLIVKEKVRLRELHDTLVSRMVAFSSAVEKTREAQLYIDAQEDISPSHKSAAVEEHLRMNASLDRAHKGDRSAWIRTPLSKQASSPMGIIEAGVEMEVLHAAKDSAGRASLTPRLAPDVVHSKLEEAAADEVGTARVQVVAMKKLTGELHRALNVLNVYVRVTAFVLWASLIGWIFVYACVADVVQ